MRPSTDASGTPPRFPSLCREFKVFDHPTSIHSGYGIFGTGRSPNCHTPAMLIIGIILFGLLVGAVAQLIVGKSNRASTGVWPAPRESAARSSAVWSSASSPVTASHCVPAASSARSRARSSSPLPVVVEVAPGGGDQLRLTPPQHHPRADRFGRHCHSCPYRTSRDNSHPRRCVTPTPAPPKEQSCPLPST